MARFPEPPSDVIPSPLWAANLQEYVDPEDCWMPCPGEPFPLNSLTWPYTLVRTLEYHPAQMIHREVLVTRAPGWVVGMCAVVGRGPVVQGPTLAETWFHTPRVARQRLAFLHLTAGVEAFQGGLQGYGMALVAAGDGWRLQRLGSWQPWHVHHPDLCNDERED